MKVVFKQNVNDDLNSSSGGEFDTPRDLHHRSTTILCDPKKFNLQNGHIWCDLLEFSYEEVSSFDRLKLEVSLG